MKTLSKRYNLSKVARNANRIPRWSLVLLYLYIEVISLIVFAEPNDNRYYLQPGTIGMVIRNEYNNSLVVRITHGEMKDKYVRIGRSDLVTKNVSISDLSSYFKNKDVYSEKHINQASVYNVIKLNQEMPSQIIPDNETSKLEYDQVSGHKYDFAYTLKTLKDINPEKCPSCMENIRKCKNNSAGGASIGSSVGVSRSILNKAQGTRGNYSGSVDTNANTNTYSNSGSNYNYNYTPIYSGKEIASSCSDIMSQDGTVGPLGRKIQETIINARSNYGAMYSDSYLKVDALSDTICPQFNNMNVQEKLNAWTWYWMVLANQESECNPNKLHKTHGWVKTKKGKKIWKLLNRVEGWGLFAGERWLGDRKWRGPMCRGDMEDVDVQINCAVHTMYDQQLSRGIDMLSTQRQYWGPNKRADTDILPNMTLYAPCWRN